MVLGFGEMLKEDRPSEDMWMDDERLVEHFKEREAVHAEKYGNKDDKDDWGPAASLIENEAANRLLEQIGVKVK